MSVRSHEAGSVEPIGGVTDARRLSAVVRAELRGHLDDADLDAVVGTLRIACGVPIAVVNIVTHDLQTYPAEVGVGAPCTAVPDELSFCAEVVDTRAPLSVPDARAHPVYSENPLVRAGQVGAYAGVPLIDDGVVLGSVAIFDREAREFTPEELELLDYQARLAASVLALRRSARTDVLTGLPNRAVLGERLAQAIDRLARHPGYAAVLYLDLDGFKDLNDSRGHDVGDWVLVEFARRLTAILRPTDTLVRLGGDEFVAICEDVADVADGEGIAQRMVDAVGAEWVFRGREVSVEVSVGVALTDMRTADAEALVRAADVAMYVAKRRGGSAWELAAASDEMTA
jgi:diguanylate cyclase (GGDEF)-like protein